MAAPECGPSCREGAAEVFLTPGLSVSAVDTAATALRFLRVERWAEIAARVLQEVISSLLR